MIAKHVKDELQKYASATDAVFLQRYFKTGKGQYGEGDVFVGVRVPQIRKVSQQFKDLPPGEVQKLLDSKVHEHRLCGLIILALQYAKGTEQQRSAIYEQYIKNVYEGRINNWDLIDLSALSIVGEHLVDRPRNILYELAKSDDLWQRRVAVLSSFAFIKRGDPSTSLELAELLLHDGHDLIQKAVGWMLREIGKRCDRQTLLDFLDQHAHEMPRTMLRYSLEHLPPDQKAHYMQ